MTDEEQRLRDALECIASQGIGHWDWEQRKIVEDNGSGRPWKHWATRAQDALDGKTLNA